MFVLRAAFPDKTGQIQAICRETASIASARSWLSLEAETAASASAFSAASIALSSDSDIFGMGFSIHRRVSKGARKSGPPDLRTIDADLGQARDRCAVPTRLGKADQGPDEIDGRREEFSACGQQKSRPPFPAPGAILRISFRHLHHLRTERKNKMRRTKCANHQAFCGRVPDTSAHRTKAEVIPAGAPGPHSTDSAAKVGEELPANKNSQESNRAERIFESTLRIGARS